MKRTTKRVISVILTLAMTMSMFTVVALTSAQAVSYDYTVSSTVVRGANDREFNIKYELTSNTRGMFGFGRMITFDKTKVEFLGLSHNYSLFPDMYDVDTNAIQKANNDGKFFYTAYNDQINQNITGTGAIGTLKFRLRDGVSTSTVITLPSETRTGYDFYVNGENTYAISGLWTDPSFKYDDIKYDGDVSIKAASRVVSAAERTFAVDYDLTANTKGIYSIGFDVQYDKNKIELVSCNQTNSVFNESYEWQKADYDLANSRGKFFYTAWLSNIYDVCTSTNGHVMTLLFKVKSGVTSLNDVVISATQRDGYNIRYATPGDESSATYVNVTVASATPPIFIGTLPGDIDLNNKVNLLDVRTGVLNVLKEGYQWDPVAFLNADVDYNNVVNVNDIYLISKAIANNDYSILQPVA